MAATHLAFVLRCWPLPAHPAARSGFAGVAPEPPQILNHGERSRGDLKGGGQQGRDDMKIKIRDLVGKGSKRLDPRPRMIKGRYSYHGRRWRLRAAGRPRGKKGSGGMKCVIWNVGGWKTHVDDIKTMICDSSPDVMMIQETRLPSDQQKRAQREMEALGYDCCFGAPTPRGRDSRGRWRARHGQVPGLVTICKSGCTIHPGRAYTSGARGTGSER